MLKVRSSIHNHCNFCDGKNTAEEMIKSAIKAGFTDFGMSSHAPIEACPVSWAMRDENGYVDTIRELKNKYNKEIRVYCGIEEDYFSTSRRGKGYDYILDSVHKIRADGKYYSVDSSADTFERCMNEGFGGDGLKMCRAYYELVNKMIEEKKTEVLCHVDLVTKFNDGFKYFDESDKKYLDDVKQSLCLAKEKGVIVELNYGAIARKCKSTPYPASYLLDFLRERKARILIGADCHNADFISFGFSEGVELLKEYGFREVTVYKEGKYQEQGI